MTLDWKTLLGLAALLVAYLVKRYVPQKTTRLEYAEHITRIDLQYTDLAVFHLNTRMPVSEPHLVDLVLKNRGPGNYKAADMASGTLTVSLGRWARGVAVAGVWVDNEPLPYDPSLINAERFAYPTVNINKDQRAIVRVICAGVPEVNWHWNLPDADLFASRSREREAPSPIPGVAVSLASLFGAWSAGNLATQSQDPLWWLVALGCLYAAWQGWWYWVRS